MNTGNKIAVAPDTRQLKRTISNGVRDVNKAEHFPALPTANMHSTTGARLSRMSSSFKDVVTTEPESREKKIIFQSSDASFASPSASPRIGARHQPLESKPAQEVQKVEESQPVRLQQASDVDLDGYRQSKARQSGSPRSPRSTKDFSAARAALNDALSGAPTASQDRLFGFPAHPNRFSLLAQSGSSRTRSTTACEETTVADSTNTLTEATPKAESRGSLKKSAYELYDTSLLWREPKGPKESAYRLYNTSLLWKEYDIQATEELYDTSLLWRESRGPKESAYRMYNTSLLWKSYDIQSAEEEDLYDTSLLWAESSQAQAAQEEDVNSSTAHPQLREGGFFSKVGGAAQGVERYMRQHPKTTAAVTVVALTAVNFLLSRRRR